MYAHTKRAEPMGYSVLLPSKEARAIRGKPTKSETNQIGASTTAVPIESPTLAKIENIMAAMEGNETLPVPSGGGAQKKNKGTPSEVNTTVAKAVKPRGRTKRNM